MQYRRLKNGDAMGKQLSCGSEAYFCGNGCCLWLFVFLGMMGGRFLSGIVCVMLPVKIELLTLAGLVITGLGCVPIYPSIIHSTPSNFGAENSQAIIGIQMASAYVGSTFLPPLFGVIANHVSMKLFSTFLLLFFALMIFMVEITFRKVYH